MPQATQTPALRPYSRLQRVTMAKSGPGLITALRYWRHEPVIAEIPAMEMA